MKYEIRTGTVESFFAEALKTAERADRGERIESVVSVTIEDPEDFFRVLSEPRRSILRSVMHTGPKSIAELSAQLKRDRSTLTKDIKILELLGLLETEKVANPGHGQHRLVRAVAAEIELHGAIR